MPSTPGEPDYAVFAGEVNDGRTWLDAMAEWNRRQPGNRAESVKNFRRDCRQAYERVTGERLRWKGVKEREHS